MSETLPRRVIAGVLTAVGVVATAGLSSAATATPPVSGQDDPQTTLIRLQDARISQALSQARRRHHPFVAVSGDGERTVVLTRRAQPYSLSEVAGEFPSLVQRRGPVSYLLAAHVLVAPDADLRISGRTPVHLLLESGPTGFTTLVGDHARIEILGRPHARITMRSVGAGGAPDQIEDDGRAYVEMRSGWMVVKHARFSYLGFRVGRASGVAWFGNVTSKSRGSASYAEFDHNHFGAFTWESLAMTWAHDVFHDNTVYGFDPHDGSDHFLVTRNLAYDNAKHGFIFSRGCHGNVMTHNVARDNGVDGFMLDDGKVVDDGTASHSHAVGSNDNLIAYNRSVGNGEVGVEVEGGAGNVVRDNWIIGNRFGVRVNSNAVSTTVVGNHVANSEVFGVYIYKGARDTTVTANDIAGAQTGVLVAGPNSDVSDNSIRAVTMHGIAIRQGGSAANLEANAISGRGSSAIDLMSAPGPVAVSGNTVRWQPGHGRRYVKTVLTFVKYHPLAPLWLLFFIAPMTLSIPARRHASRSRPTRA